MDKSEITKLPEGMTSEELDVLTTGEDVPEKDEDLAREALDATEESSEAEDSVKDETTEETEEKKETTEPELSEEQKQLRAKDSKIASQKHENRDLAIENARIQGQLDARKELQVEVEEPVKSPLEIAEDAFKKEHGSLDGFAMNGELYRSQRAFDDAQAATKANTDQQAKASTSLLGAAESLQEGDLSIEKMGEGLDFQTIANIGDKYLTRGDKVDLADIQARRGHTAALKESYKVMTSRILAANNEDSKLIKNAQGKTKTQTKPKKEEKTDIDALATEGEETDTGGVENTHSARLANFVCG